MSVKTMETADTENGWTLRLFVLLLFASVLFIGVASFFYIFENTSWSQMDQTLATAIKLFYFYVSLSGMCLFAVLIWLVIDERKIGRLTQQLEEEKERGN